MNKYRNKKTVIDGITFDSMKEATRYCELRLLEKAGEIAELELQKRYEIIPKGNGERAAYYIADFVYMEDGKQVIEDVKSNITRKNPAYILKRKLIKQKYPEAEFLET